MPRKCPFPIELSLNERAHLERVANKYTSPYRDVVRAKIILFAAIAGIFQGGLDLVFFDEYMKTIPDEYSAILVSLGQSIQYLSAVAFPLIGTSLANYIGLGGVLWVSAGLRLIGFLLFLIPMKKPPGEITSLPQQSSTIGSSIPP